MYYQDIPFLIVAKDVGTGSNIARILKRKINTHIECYDSESIQQFQESINYFMCNVFCYAGHDQLLDEIIANSLQKRPLSPVVLFSFDPIEEEVFRNYVRMGVTDVITYPGPESNEDLSLVLLKSINHRWKIFRYMERERKKIYQATVVTAYHEINQPLTVIMNTIDLFNIELKRSSIDTDKLRQNLLFVLKAIKRIQEILEKLKSVEQPRLKAYTKTVPMISLHPDKDKFNLKLVQEMRVSRNSPSGKDPK